jgi:hypothetical protein
MAEEYIPPKSLGPVEDGYIPPKSLGPVEDGYIPPKSLGPVEEEQEESDQSVIGSIARGAGAGFVDIAQGIAELGASGLTAAGVLDGEEQQNTTKFFEDAKTAMGLTPERTAGKIVETIVNYGAPGIGVFSWVSKADKARRALKAGTKIPDPRSWFGKSAAAFGKSGAGAATTTRAGRAALTTMGTGVADVFVSPSTNTTLADSWDAMPEGLQTEAEANLTGKDLAAVRLRNKFRLGIEGAAFNLAGEIILPVAGATIKGIGSSEISGIPLLARGISAGFDGLGRLAGKSNFLKKNFTANGMAPEEVAVAVRTAQGISEGEEAAASKLISQYDGALKKAIRFQNLPGRGKAATQKAYNDTMDFMTGQTNTNGELVMPDATFIKLYGPKVKVSVDNMRNKITDLTKEFETSVRAAPNLTKKQADDLILEFDTNQGVYLRRLYEMNLNPDKFSGIDPKTLPQFKTAVQQIADIKQKQNPAMDTQTAYQQAEQHVLSMFNKDSIEGGIDSAITAKNKLQFVGKGANEVVGRTSLFKLSSGMLESRSEYLSQAPMLREMMGEIRNPKEAFLRTVDDMSNTIASQRLFDDISNNSKSLIQGNEGRAMSYAEGAAKINAGGRPFVVDGNGLTDPMIKDLVDNGYVKAGEIPTNKIDPFGGKFGSLTGNYVASEIFNSLTTPGRSSSWVQEALSVSLQLKGASQMTKTVLNPLSQVRNFLSNVFVVGANGLLGRNMGIFESGGVLMANALDSPEQFRLLKAMRDEGAIGQNIQLNEMRALFQEQTELGVSSALVKGGAALRKTKGVGTAIKFMEKTYQLGDDYWKVVGALGETARYGAAMRKAGLDIDNLDDAMQQALKNSGLAQRTSSIAGTDFGNMLATDLIKQTMPTYSMVPEAIKALRRIPVMGNFISFPAEIIRTTGNILNRSVKELSFKADDAFIEQLMRSKNISKEIATQQANAFARQVRGIGAERLSGYVAMATVAPMGIRDASHTMLGVTEAEEDLLQKAAPPWSLGNTLMYITKPDEDLNAEAVDLSYMLPYEFMYAPARAALQIYQEKGELNANEANQIASGAFAAFKKFAEPFASESLGAERLLDVTIRDGKTQTGAEIYESGELLGDRLQKSLVHVAGAFMPGAIEQFTTVKGGEFKQGRSTRALTGTPSKSGDDYSVAEEAGTMLTGLRPMKVNIGRTLGYNGGAYAADRSSSTQIFTKVADDNDATVEDITDAYVQANEAKRSHQARLKIKIDAALAAGMTKGQVRQAFKDTGVTSKELNNIFRNRYDPIKISRALLREVSREVNVKKESRILSRVPTQEVNAIRRSLINTEIIAGEKPVEPNYVPPQSLGPVNPSDYVPPQSLGPVNTVTTPTQPTESFVAPVTNAISGAVDTVSNFGEGLYDRARTLAPGFIGDPKNQSIVDRANQ